MKSDTRAYNDSQSHEDRKICNLLAREIDKNLAETENKIWHRHPVWFLDGNPIVGYSNLKDSFRTNTLGLDTYEMANCRGHIVYKHKKQIKWITM